jgi:hypothetical protein
MPPPPMRQPVTTSALAPKRRASRPVNMPAANIVIADGSSMSPDG